MDLGNIVQAACLAHDIGNPPFGHAGEKAVSFWFQGSGRKYLAGLDENDVRDLSKCEGNAQGFRILTQTESNVFRGGLRLTYATLGAFMKYPRTSAQGGTKFGVYLSEEGILDEIASGLGLIRLEGDKWCRHPLAFLTEAADDICYAVLDLEDAVELRVLQFREVANLLLTVLDEETRSKIEDSIVDENEFRVNFSRIRGPVFDALIEAAVNAFVLNSGRIMSGTAGETPLFSLLAKDDPHRLLIDDAKEMGRIDVYPEEFKSEVELGCFTTLAILLDAFCAAAVEQAQCLTDPMERMTLSHKSDLVLRKLGNHAPNAENAPDKRGWNNYLCLRRVLDYILGMTDNFARDLSRHLRGDTAYYSPYT